MQEPLFHISEEGNISRFLPRPSPSAFAAIRGDVVFAISKLLLHNYLFPRDCPRVAYYAGPGCSVADREKFLRQSKARFVLAIESGWLRAVQQTRLYCYEFPTEDFVLLDECAGYYISYRQVVPLSVNRIDSPLEELLKRGDIELRVLPELWSLADQVSQSSLNFSLIRMRNAASRP